MNQGDSCYSSCTTPEMISFNDSKYDSWRPTPPLALYGIQDVLQVRDAVYDSPGSDRGCYRCRITHEGSSAERLIFLRVRGKYWGGVHGLCMRRLAAGHAEMHTRALTSPHQSAILVYICECVC